MFFENGLRLGSSLIDFSKILSLFDGFVDGFMFLRMIIGNVNRLEHRVSNDTDFRIFLEEFLSQGLKLKFC